MAGSPVLIADPNGGGGVAPGQGSGRRRRSRGLSALLQQSIVLGAALAMVLFAAPLAVAVQGLYRAQFFAGLAGDAEKMHAQVSAEVSGRRQGGAEEVVVHSPAPRTEHAVVGIYTLQGELAGGTGPRHADRLVREVAQVGVEDEGIVGDDVVVAVPVDAGSSGTLYVVRAAAPVAEIQGRTYATWAVMAGLGALVLVVVSGVGRARARRMARPLQSLAASADALGHGDFSIRAVHAGVSEIDAVSDNLERTAQRLSGMLERERSFSADASHQLRTPLTAVRIGLESALLTPGADLNTAVEQALVGLDRLERTVLDLLALARDTSGPRERIDVGALVGEATARWSRTLADRGRDLQAHLEPDLPAASVSRPALRTVLDVLLDNALIHGAGRVQVLVRATEETVTLQVTDEGPGVQGDPARLFVRRSAGARGTGIGLALARSLVEADGGRLELTRIAPATFVLLLPVAAEPRPGTGGPARGRHPLRPGTARATGS